METFDIKQFNQKRVRTSQFLPWFAIVRDAEGIVLQRDGLLQRTFRYRGPDMDTESLAALAGLCQSVNYTIRTNEPGWAHHFESQRKATCVYPGGIFSRPGPFMFDIERRMFYEETKEHYENSYYHTISYLLPRDLIRKVGNFWFKGDDSYVHDFDNQIMSFIEKTNNLVSPLRRSLRVQALNADQTLTYLHTNVSMNWHPIKKPARLLYLNHILADSHVKNALTIQVDDYYCVMITVNDFGLTTHPGILNVLNQTNVEYRMVIRYLPSSRDEAEKELNDYSKLYFSNRTSLSQSLKAGMDGETASTNRENIGAQVMEGDANQALADLATESVHYGNVSFTIMVWDKDYGTAHEKADHMTGLVRAQNMTCYKEEVHSMEAWQGMMAGNVYANIRRPLISTGNLSHILPITAMWPGEAKNPIMEQLSGVDAPHVMTSTRTGTPFFLNMNVGKVFHSLVVGPTGGGKSIILSTLAMSTDKHPGSRNIFFDIDMSCRGTIMAAGGDFYIPLRRSTKFQPLKELNEAEDFNFALEFVELLLTCQKMIVTSTERTLIIDGLNVLKGYEEKHRRNIGSLMGAIQNKKICEILKIYSVEGPYEEMFDCSDGDNFEISDWMGFEMRPLLEAGEAVFLPAMAYLFRKIEKSFDNRRLQIFIDEAWVMLANPYFENWIRRALKTFRKRNVGVTLCTQELNDAANSNITSTIVQQCPMKIYLPDPEATTTHLRSAYRAFGLTDSEILKLSMLQPAQDYLYKSPKGVRQFSLDLGPVQLALIDLRDHNFLDELEKNYPKEEWVWKILEDKNIPDLAAIREFVESQQEYSTIRGEEE